MALEPEHFQISYVFCNAHFFCDALASAIKFIRRKAGNFPFFNGENYYRYGDLALH